MLHVELPSLGIEVGDTGEEILRPSEHHALDVTEQGAAQSAAAGRRRQDQQFQIVAQEKLQSNECEAGDSTVRFNHKALTSLWNRIEQFLPVRIGITELRPRFGAGQHGNDGGSIFRLVRPDGVAHRFTCGRQARSFVTVTGVSPRSGRTSWVSLSTTSRVCTPFPLAWKRIRLPACVEAARYAMILSADSDGSGSPDRTLQRTRCSPRCFTTARVVSLNSP